MVLIIMPLNRKFDGIALEISGEFIYDGIQALNTMDSSSNSAELFSFLYHISVGIERLQKITS